MKIAKLKTSILITFILAAFICCPRAYAGDEHGHDHSQGHGSHGHGGHEEEGSHGEEPIKGPHGGRLLSEGTFSIEITIFETGVPPQFRVYPYEASKPLSPAAVKVQLELARFGGQKDQFSLAPSGEFLTSEKTAEEPHSFTVHVAAEYAGQKFSWEYESFEGRTVLSSTAVKAADIGFDVAGPQTIAQTAVVYGQISPNEDRVAHIHPRFPGIVKQINKSLGDTVKSGEVLAVVESNQSLKEYEVKSQLSGVVIERHLTLGEYVAEDQQLFVVADLSQVWADLHVYRDDFAAAAVGREIMIDADDGGATVSAVVTYVSPVTDAVTQSKRIRAVISNTDGRLRPGIFIKGSLHGSDSKVPVAVRREALQTFRDWNVVFVTDGHVFQAVPVEVARKDSKYAEILSGISAGQKYVSENSYIIKADIEKSGASHDH